MTFLELFTKRDSPIWKIGFWSSMLVFVVNHTSLVSPVYHVLVQDIASVFGFLSASMGMSPLATSNDFVPPKDK